MALLMIHSVHESPAPADLRNQMVSGINLYRLFGFRCYHCKKRSVAAEGFVNYSRVNRQEKEKQIVNNLKLRRLASFFKWCQSELYLETFKIVGMNDYMRYCVCLKV